MLDCLKCFGFNAYAPILDLISQITERKDAVARTVALFLLLAVCVAGGCAKEVQLTFVNHVDQTLRVDVTTPNDGREILGMVGPHGRIGQKVKFENDELPSTVTWKAGAYGDTFTVDKDTASKLWIHIGKELGPIDKKTEVKEQTETEIKNQKVGQGTVVE